MKQGARANLTGKRFEDFIEQTLISLGYRPVHKKQFKPALCLKQPIYTKQFFVGKSIYETNIFCDLILYHPEKWKDCLIIECKWQQAGGSVDEKYPYLILNIQQKYPHKTLLLLDGGGYKEGAENWIKKQKGGNLLAIKNMCQFQMWVNKDKL